LINAYKVASKIKGQDTNQIVEKLKEPKLFECDSKLLNSFFTLFAGEYISFQEIEAYKNVTGTELELKRDWKLLRKLSINAVSKQSKMREAE